uniref:Uncharacterized protein n=1 Tax=Anopheles marajoara TaxID=58244 RepID=A0A2M4BE84_9DIPT
MEATDGEECTAASSSGMVRLTGDESGSLEGETPKQTAQMGDEDGDGILSQQLAAGPALNQQLLDQLNGQFQKQLQLAEREQLGEGFKISVYADWVASLRTINTELVESLREMQDTCLERMQLMRASYLKDLVRFGPDIRLKRLETMGLTEPSDNGTDRVVSLELSSNYPIIPATDELLLREVDTKSREVNELRKALDDQRRLSDDREALVEQLRDLAQERDKQLNEKAKELGVLQQRIDLLNMQLTQAKMSAAALTDNKSLISEITDHHDKITQLRQRLKEQEDNLREANVAIQFRDEVIAQQRQEIKVLTENAVSTVRESPQEGDKSFDLQLTSSRSFHSTISEDDSDLTAVEPVPVVSVSTDLFGTIQKQSETESQCVATLKRELAEMHNQLHEYKRRALSVTPELSISQEVTEQAFSRLRAACAELLQNTGKFVCVPGDSPLETGRFEDVEQLIKRLQDRCETLCRKLSDHATCTMDQDEGIGSGNTSRMGTSSELQAHQLSQQERQYAEAVVSTMVVRLEHMLGKENATSASESLSSFSLGLDDGCALQGLLEDLKKEIDAKELVLRDRQAELERSQEQLASTERQLKHLQAKQSTFDTQRAALEAKILDLEQMVDDQGRIIMMMKSQNTSLQQQAEDLKETLHQYRDNLQKTSEEKVAIEDECKNQLVTISNLRVALEETKRNGSSSVSLFSGLRYSQPPLRSPTAALNGQGGSTSDCVSDSVSSQQQNHQQQRLQEALPTAITSTNTGMTSTISPSSSPSSSVSNVGPSNANTNTNATDYWSAIGRALFSGFDS